MCGLVGYLGGRSHSGSTSDGNRILAKMADAIATRGPDDAGYWMHSSHPVGFGHRRLAIVDLSPAGHQPMASASGRYVIAFNGEIYNHMELRKQLAANREVAWRGHSDTETLLAGFDAWGIAYTIERAIGMFAFAVWDNQTATLTLGRDRVGEKPLYYGWQGKGDDATFLFGSELKALRVHPAFENTIDRGALCLQMRYNCIPAPHSIYQGIAKLKPGCLLTVSMTQRHPSISAYWSAKQAVLAGIADPFSGTPVEAVDVLEELLKGAVRQQMMADVPLGAFLSGGVDSSLIVALMQAQSGERIKTFSIGFHEEAYNEAVHAAAVAKHLGTDHTELYASAKDMLDTIPILPSLYDEPFSDSSQVPTYLVSKLARQHVTVSLSGDAGDELFCGYGRYATATRTWSRIAGMPMPVRRLIAKGLRGISVRAWNDLARVFSGALPSQLRAMNVGDKLHKGAGILTSETLGAFYCGMISHWTDPELLVLGAQEPRTLLNGDTPDLGTADVTQKLMAFDLLTYLPDDILVKVDRAAMGASLETRVPLLDHRVVEFAWRLPQSMKLRDGKTKWALREVLYRYVPRSLIERPKMGFGVPIKAWLRGPLREWGEELLDSRRLGSEGFFDPVLVRQKWEEHLSGQRNWQYQLWDILMFQAWLEHQH